MDGIASTTNTLIDTVYKPAVIGLLSTTVALLGYIAVWIST